MGSSFVFIQDLQQAGGEEALVEWTDITSTPLLITPNLPGTTLTGTCDFTSAASAVTDMKDSSAVSFSPLSNKGVRGGYFITADNAGTLVERGVATLDGDSNTLTTGATWNFTGADATFWITPPKTHRFVILAFELFVAGAGEFTIQDESGATVYGPIWTAGAAGAAMEIARRCTDKERLYISQDSGSAVAGSIHMWWMSEKSF